MLRLAAAASFALAFGAGPGLAHEFWISPAMYRWPAGETVLADLRVGEGFRGGPQGFLPARFERFEILTSEGPVTVGGHAGDIPALSVSDLPEGLAVIVHQTTAGNTTWHAWESFAAFAEHKGLGDVAEMHSERGLDRARVREDYVRFAKSLVAVGHGEGEDTVVGLRAELVALANPYTDDLAGALPVQLWFDGAPLPMARVEVHVRPSEGDTGQTTSSVYQTDSNGIVVLPVDPGMEYLVSAVTMEAVETQGRADAPQWRTLWASLTFEVPVPGSTP